MKNAKLGALVAGAVIVFAACSSPVGRRRTAACAAPAAGGQPEACKNKKGTSSSEIHVYSSLPRQGTNTEQTNTLVEQIKETLDGQKVGNFTIKYFDLDDSSAANNGDWDGAVEQQNANKAAADPDAMVYIGTYNSGAAKLSIPILNQACLVMVSPANSYPGLTKAVEGVTQPGEPDTYYPAGYRNYARVIATDDIQGAAGAEWAKSLGKTKAYVLDDTQVYGAGLPRPGRSMPTRSASRSSARTRRPRASTRRRPTTAPWPRRSRPPVPTSSTSARSPARTPASSGRTFVRRCRTSTIMSGDGVFEKSWYEGAGAAGNGTFLHLRRRRSGSADRRRQGVVRQVQGRPRRQPAGDLHGLRQRRRGGRPGRPPEGWRPTIATRSSRPSWRPRTCRPSSARRRSTPNGDAVGGSISGYKVETSWPPAFQLDPRASRN